MKRIDQDNLSCAWCGRVFERVKDGPFGPERPYVYEFGTRLYCPDTTDCLMADTKTVRVEAGVSREGRTVLFGNELPTREETMLYLAGSLIGAAKSYRARTNASLEQAKEALATCRIRDERAKT